MARLVCPLCGAVVVDGGEPAPGACPGCGALFAGGGESPPAGVAAALAQWGIDGIPADDLALRLFEAEPPPAPEAGAAITSDERQGFYLWWVFVRPAGAGVDGALRELLAR